MSIFVPVGIALIEGLALGTQIFSNTIFEYFESIKDLVTRLRLEQTVTFDADMFVVGITIGVAFIGGTIFMRRWKID